MRGSRFALLLITALLVENFLGFHPQVWSITLLLPERVLPTLAAKIKRKIRTAKQFGEKVRTEGEQRENYSVFCIQHSIQVPIEVLQYYSERK